MDAAKALSELREKIAAKRKELEEQEHALAVLERMLGAPAVTSTSRPASVISQQPAVAKQDVAGVRVPQREVLIQAIDTMEGAEFTVSMIDDALNKMGKRFDGNKPKNRISVLLGQLVERRVIEQTHTGGGNVPHRYRKVQPE